MAHHDLVNSLAFSPDGNLLASGGFREIKLWRRPRNVQKFALTPDSHEAVLALAVSPDGKWLATGDDEGRIRLWNMDTGKSVKRLSGHTGAVNNLQFSPDNRRLASGSADKSIRVWDVARGSPLFRAQTTAEVNAVAWIAGGDQILSGGADELVHLWFVDTARGELRALREFRGHEGPVTALASLPPDDAQFISGSGDGTLPASGTSERVGSFAKWSMAGRSRPLRCAKTANALPPPVSTRPPNCGTRRRARRSRNWLATHYLLGQVAEKERGLTLANHELTYRNKTWQTATNEHKAQLERVHKAIETLAAADKIYHEKQAKVTEAAAVRTDGEKALVNFPEIKQATEAYETAEKTAAQAAAKLKTAKENPTPDPSGDGGSFPLRRRKTSPSWPPRQRRPWTNFRTMSAKNTNKRTTRSTKQPRF